MTMPLTGNFFDLSAAHPVKRTGNSRSVSRGRAVAVAVTAALHVAVAAELIAGVQVASRKMPPALMVRINLTKPEAAQDTAPPPLQLQVPTAITMPPPEFTVQTTSSPILVQQQVTTPVPPPAATAPQKAAGESGETFNARLLAQLNRFKQYPRVARQAHIEGVVMLHFVMDASGKVILAEIAQSSGRPVLDAEALALIRRAQPLPPLPADIPTRTLDAVVPITFSLNG
jgi:protein TonB